MVSKRKDDPVSEYSEQDRADADDVLQEIGMYFDLLAMLHGDDDMALGDAITIHVSSTNENALKIADEVMNARIADEEHAHLRQMCDVRITRTPGAIEFFVRRARE